VACVPVGYQFSIGNRLIGDTNVALRVEAEAQAPAEKSAPTFENSALFAEWRELHVTYGTNALAMPAIYKAITNLNDPFRQRAFRSALIAEWVQVDAAGGLAFFVRKGADEAQRQEFLEEWLASDPRGAVEALLRCTGEWEEMARSCLPSIARLAPSRLAEIVSRLPKSEDYWDANVRDAFGVLAEGNLSSAIKSAESVTGPSRQDALSGIARVWGKIDSDGALAWAKTIPAGPDHDEVLRSVLLGKASVDPAAALDLTGLVPSGGKHAYFATTTGARVLAEAAKTDFDATVGFVVEHPGRFGGDDILGLAHEVAERLNANPAGFLDTRSADGTLATLLPAIQSALLNQASGQRAAVWDWLKAQPDSEPTKSLKEEVLKSAGYQDPALALRLAADLPRTPEGDSQLETLARALFNGGSQLNRFDNLLQQAPAPLRQPLIDTAFKLLNGDNLDDPQHWIANLSLLPDASRSRGVEAIARAWAQQRPEEAMEWAGSFAAGDARDGAVAAITSAWAKKDPSGAADWVTSLPSGTERDHSVEALVLGLAEKHPREAWEWALSITDETQRSTAAAQAAKMMAAQDLATARQWIESGPFSADVKMKLQSGLSTASRSSGSH